MSDWWASQAIVAPAEHVFWTLVDGEVLLMTNDDSAAYHGLRGAAVRIWELIDARAHSPEGILRTLLAEFAVEESVLRADVASTLDGLTARGLIKIQAE